MLADILRCHFDRLIATPTVTQGRMWCNLSPVSLTKLHTKLSIKLELLDLQKSCRHEIDHWLGHFSWLPRQAFSQVQAIKWLRLSPGGIFIDLEGHSPATSAACHMLQHLHEKCNKNYFTISATATNAAPIKLDRG
jgi:hypothetical protein